MTQYEQIGSIRMPVDPPGMDEETIRPTYGLDRGVGLPPVSRWEPHVARRRPWWVWLAGLVVVTALSAGIVVFVADRATAEPMPEAGWSAVERQVREAAVWRAEAARTSRPVCADRGDGR